MNWIRNKKLIVISVLLVGLLALVGCSGDDDDDGNTKTYSASGKVVRKTESGEQEIENFKLKAGDQITRTNKQGEWSFSGLHEGTKIVPVGNDTYKKDSVKRGSITVNKDLTGVKFVVTGEGLGSTDINAEEVDYKLKSGNTRITLSFGEDLKLKGDNTFSKENITVQGLPEGKQFTVQTQETEGKNDGDDPSDDYLEDKNLIIKIPGRVAGELKVIIKAGTLVSRDPDGDKGTIGRLKSSTLNLSSSTALVDLNDGNAVKRVNNKQKKVVVHWNDSWATKEGWPTVKQVNNALQPQVYKKDGSDAEIISIAGVNVKANPESTETVRINPVIKVRAEDGTKATYTIALDPAVTDNKVMSKEVELGRRFSNADRGNAYYNVKESKQQNVIKSKAKRLAGVTTAADLKQDLELSCEDLTKAEDLKVIPGDQYADDEIRENFADIKELTGKLAQANQPKVAVKAVNGEVRIYDLQLKAAYETTKVTYNVGYKDVVLNVDHEQNQITLSGKIDTDKQADEVLLGVDQAALPADKTIQKVINNGLKVTAQNEDATEKYAVNLKPAISKAVVKDGKGNEIQITFTQEMGMSNAKGFTVKVNNEPVEIDGIRNVGEDASSTNSTKKVALVLKSESPEQERIKENDTVVLKYNPEATGSDVNSEDGGVELFGHDHFEVTNKVKGPKLENVYAADNSPRKLVLEFKNDGKDYNGIQDITDNGDYEDIEPRERFTITVDEETINISDEAAIKFQAGKDRIILPLERKIIEGEDIEVTYQAQDPEYIIDEDGDQTLGFETQGVRNKVNAPNYKRIVNNGQQAGIKDSDALNDQILVEFDDQMKIAGDSTKAAEAFKVTVASDEQDKIVGYQDADQKTIAVKDISLKNNSEQVLLKLEKEVLATERVEVSYSPDVQKDTDVLVDKDDGVNVVRPFGAGIGDNSDSGKSVPNAIAVPSLTKAEIKDGEANVIYLYFDGEVVVNDKNVNDWFKVAGDRKVEAVVDASAEVVKLVLAKGVKGKDQQGPETVAVTYKPQLRTKKASAVGLLEDTNGNQLLRNKVAAENKVKSSQYASAKVTDEQPGQITVNFDEEGLDQGEIVDIAVTNSTKGFTLDYKDVKIDSVTAGGASDQIIVKLDGKIKADDTATLKYNGKGNLIDNNENDTAVSSEADQDIKVPAFTANLDPKDENGDQAENLVERPEFVRAEVRDGDDEQRQKVYVYFDELLGIEKDDEDWSKTPINASATDDEYADNNFTITNKNGSRDYSIIESKLRDVNSVEQPQLVFKLKQPVTDDDQQLELSYVAAGDYVEKKFNDGDGNCVEKFSDKPIENLLETPDFKSAVVTDTYPNKLKVTFDNPGSSSLEVVDETDDKQTITVEVDGTSVDVSNPAVAGDTITYDLATPVETGEQTITVKHTANNEPIKAGDGDTVSEFDSSELEDAVDNQVEGPEIESAYIEDDKSNKVKVVFDQDLADNNDDVRGATTTNYKKLKAQFRINGTQPEKVTAGNQDNVLVLKLPYHVVPADIRDDRNKEPITLNYTPGGYLADEFGNKMTTAYSDEGIEVDNQVKSDIKVTDGQTTGKKEITISFNKQVKLAKDNAELDLDIEEANGQLTIDSYNCQGNKLVIKTNEEIKSTYNDFMVKYNPDFTGSSNNLVGLDNDPVKYFTIPVKNRQ